MTIHHTFSKYVSKYMRCQEYVPQNNPNSQYCSKGYQHYLVNERNSFFLDPIQNLRCEIGDEDVTTCKKKKNHERHWICWIQDNVWFMLWKNKINKLDLNCSWHIIYSKNWNQTLVASKWDIETEREKMKNKSRQRK